MYMQCATVTITCYCKYINKKKTPAGFRFKVLLEQTALTNIRTFTNLNTLTNAFKTGFRFKVAASL